MQEQQQTTYTFWFREKVQIVKYRLLTPEELRDCSPSTPDEYENGIGFPVLCFRYRCERKPVFTVEYSDLDYIEGCMYCSLGCMEYDATFMGNEIEGENDAE